MAIFKGNLGDAALLREMEVNMKRQDRISKSNRRDRRSRRNGKKKLAVMAMAAAISIYGCGNSAEDAQSSNVLKEEMEGAGEQGTEHLDEEGEGKENEGQPVGGEDGKGPEDDGMQGGEEDGRQTVNGMVRDVGDKRFTMELLVTTVEGDGLVMVGNDPDGETAEVNYTEDTVFTRRVTTDGETSTVQPGTLEDVRKDALVYVTGVWSGDVLQANQVEVFVDARE